MVEFDPDNKILKTVDFDRSTEELLYQLQNSTRSWMRIDACQSLAKKGERRIFYRRWRKHYPKINFMRSVRKPPRHWVRLK